MGGDGWSWGWGVQEDRVERMGLAGGEGGEEEGGWRMVRQGVC